MLSQAGWPTPGPNLNNVPWKKCRETGINQGNWYVTALDKTHDLSINTSYELSDKWQFNANFLFQTGQPTNYPVGQYELRGLNVPIFGLRNQERLPLTID